MSYTSSLFHIVFATKKREKSLTYFQRDALARYLHGISENLKCNIISMNIMPEHVHLLIDLNPETALAKFVGTIKQSSSIWLKNNIHFPLFDGWAKEYYAVSVSPSNKESVKGYIKKQETHHAVNNFNTEIKWMVESAGQQFYENSFY